MIELPKRYANRGDAHSRAPRTFRPPAIDREYSRERGSIRDEPSQGISGVANPTNRLMEGREAIRDDSQVRVAKKHSNQKQHNAAREYNSSAVLVISEGARIAAVQAQTLRPETRFMVAKDLARKGSRVNG